MFDPQVVPKLRASRRCCVAPAACCSQGSLSDRASQIHKNFKLVAECTPEELAATAAKRAARQQHQLERDAARAPAQAMQAARPFTQPRQVSANTAKRTRINPLAAFEELAGGEPDQEHDEAGRKADRG